MKNLFKRSRGTRHRGLPDNYPHHTPTQTQPPAVISPSSSSVLPGTLANDHCDYGCVDHPHAIQVPPIVYPYQASSQPALVRWKLNTGNNMNKNGRLITGDIKISGGIPSSLPDINTGYNNNEGGYQESGGICIEETSYIGFSIKELVALWLTKLIEWTARLIAQSGTGQK